MTLERLASACILPGFAGTEAPDWLRRELADGLGGAVLFSRNVAGPEQLGRLTRALHAEREDAVLAIDEEGGDVTRLEAAEGSSYPGNLALGAIDDVALTREVAAAIGADLAAVGVDLDLAPVADVNTNPANPVIGVRSFGSDPGLVARHVAAFVEGLQEQGVAACAKHFPGHGATDADSHLELPIVHAGLEELRAVELVPFRAAVEAGTRAVMTAHLLVPALSALPATVSREILTDLLRGELGFRGAVVTDALEMKAIADGVGVEEGAVLALAAGADALCLGHDLEESGTSAVRAAVVAAVRAGRLSEMRLAEAAGRTRSLAAGPTCRAGRPRPDRAIGLEAARRALRIEGTVGGSGPLAVVECVPGRLMAADPARTGLGALLRERDPAARVLRLEGAEGLDPLPAPLDGARTILVLRDAHRHAWERGLAERVLAARPDAVVVDVGYPAWRPAGAAGYVATLGAGHVNLLAAAELLCGGRPAAVA